MYVGLLAYFIWEDYLYILKTIKLDFGKSYITGRKISKDLKQKLYFTFILAVSAMIFAICFGIILGIVAALNYQSVIDRIIVLFSIIGVSTPVFSVALLFIYIFGIKFKILPPTGYGGIQFLILPTLFEFLRVLATKVLHTHTHSHTQTLLKLYTF